MSVDSHLHLHLHCVWLPYEGIFRLTVKSVDDLSKKIKETYNDYNIVVFRDFVRNLRSPLKIENLTFHADNTQIARFREYIETVLEYFEKSLIDIKTVFHEYFEHFMLNEKELVSCSKCTEKYGYKFPTETIRDISLGDTKDTIKTIKQLCPLCFLQEYNKILRLSEHNFYADIKAQQQYHLAVLWLTYCSLIKRGDYDKS